MNHQFTIRMNTADAALAMRIRDAVVGAVEDFNESKRPACSIDVGTLIDTETPLDLLYVAAARDEHEEEGRVEIDRDAVVSYGEDNGAYVAAWVWVGENPTIASAREAMEAIEDRAAELADSEGGNCD